jgi:flagella basal body P-ring formation protein FlgA
MKFAFAILFCIQIIMWTKDPAMARPEITIPNNVEISQRPKLRLGDIAIIRGANSELLVLLNNLVLRDDSRGLLLSQHLESAEILKKIKDQLEVSEFLRHANPAFKIPTRINIGFSQALISKEEIERKIKNFLSIRCMGCEFRVSIQTIPEPGSREWEPEFEQMTAKGGLLLPLRDLENRPKKWISGQIHISKLTPTTTRLIQQGERFTRDDLVMSMNDITFSKDNILRAEDLVGQIAVRTLSVGSIVGSTDCRKEPAAQKGQIAKGLLGDENFEIAVNVEIQENGFVGDIIKVKSIENNKYFSAQIVEKGVVKLQ